MYISSVKPTPIISLARVVELTRLTVPKNTNMARAVIFIFLIVVAAISAMPPCGEHEIYNSCGSTCVKTCENPILPVCTLRCNPGCECIEEYVRNAENRCVLQQDC